MRKGSSRDAESQILVTDLLRREGQAPQAERKPKTALRVLGAAAGVAVLCGTVALGITYATYDGGAQVPSARQQQSLSGIIGGKALSPNTINEQTGQQGEGGQQGGSEGQQGGDGSNGTHGGQQGREAGSGGQGGTGGQGSTGNQGGGNPGGDGGTGNPGGNPGGTVPTTGAGSPGTGSSSPTTSTGKPTSAAPTTTSKKGGLLDPILGPILDPITNFLTSAPDQPEQAYAMLAPDMQQGGLEEFKENWDGVESATVADSKADGADAAIVTVDYRWADGRTLRVEQRMVVEKLQRKISDARVLSSKGR
ncbi:hypothetical protein JOF53_005121 [Crossiella equi]|uniref:Uncharacterized protein n=1 Tax=Crossiella equi TaxID=130796 RepID=A0ABS5AI52_9PSEU|nr:hypothetical protein [Crossiella equi]MBP2476249.1 hypothetical protein [Crossiella equi]